MTDEPRSRWRWVGRVALLAIMAGGMAASSTPSASTPVSDGPYGPGIGADSLANTQVGGPSSGSPNLLTSFRFRASESEPLDSVRIYLIDGAGYSGGTGGQIAISVEADGAGPNHTPSGAVLASTTISPGNPIKGGHFPLITFPSPPSLVSGQIYHVVFQNTDPSPTVNFVSVNALWTKAITTPRQPRLTDQDWAELTNGGGGWTVRPNYTPILDLGYSDGLHQGVGYMEVWVNSPEVISGASAVREIFTPTTNRSVSSISVRVSWTYGTSPLTIRLIDSAGETVVGQAVASASANSGGPAWVTVSLSPVVVLRAGIGYQLVLSTPPDSSYSAFTLERGNNYDFDAATYFSDGYGEYTLTGSGWDGFDQPGGTHNNTNSDLQFYFP